MVDEERLARVLRRIGDDLAVLRGYASREPSEVAADAARLGHVKYLFVTMIEGCVDAAHHVLASEGWGPASTNADAVRTLARHGVLDAGRAEQVARAVGFRNILVHGYADVDDRQVLAALGRLDDIGAYVAALARLMEAP